MGEDANTKVDFLNPFLAAIAHVLTNTIFEQPVRDRIFLRTEYPFTTKEVAMLVGITGSLTGHVVITADLVSTLKIAAKMMVQESIAVFDENARSAMGELANMITGQAMIGLMEKGFNCEITPPSVVSGSGMRVSCPANIKTIVVVMKLPYGDVEVNLALAETAKLPPSAIFEPDPRKRQRRS